MNIIMIDDDPLVSFSLKTILETDPDIHIAAMGCDGKEALSLYQEHRPDILLMDIRMKEMTGLDAGEQILQEFPDAKILYLTTFSDDEYIIRALHIGAKGYILKQAFASIAPALHAVERGQSVFDGQVVTKLPNLIKNPSATKQLPPDVTDREYELIQLVAQGLNNHEIAEKMFLSEGTIRNYLSGLLDKLELRDRTQLAIYYYVNLKP